MKVFVHIPKTAGTSVRRTLERWFRLAHDNLIEESNSHDLSKDRPGETCLLGHFGGGLLRNSASLLVRYPWLMNSPDTFVFTFLRDPIKQAVSYYYHERVRGRTDLELVDFLAERHRYSYRTMLGIADVSQVDAVLSSFDFVGTTEHLQQSIDLLADRLGKPRIEVARENLGKRDTQIEDLSEAHKDQLRAFYDIEYELYRRACDVLEGRREHKCQPERRFTYAFSGAANLTAIESEARRAAQVLDAWVHSGDGESRTQFVCSKPFAVTMVFEILDANAAIEPVVTVMRDGAVAFNIAYTPDAGAHASLGPGIHKATVRIPANLLNPGRFWVRASVASPTTTERYDESSSVEFHVVEDDAADGARGSWRSPFPGAIRPLLKWDIIS